MKDNEGPRTQAARSAATRDALVRAGRELFAEHGFTAVGTEAIVRAAGVTRGALYHQFDGKQELFAAVFEAVEADVMARIDQRIVDAGADDPIEVMRLGVTAWVEICADPAVQRIALVDGPGVLGYQRWRDIGMRYGMGLVRSVLSWAMEAGRLPVQPVDPLAHILIGALDEAVHYVVGAPDQDVARGEALAALDRMITGLATG